MWSSDIGDEEGALDEESAVVGKSSVFTTEVRRRGPLDGLVANLELSTLTMRADHCANALLNCTCRKDKDTLQSSVTPFRLDWYHALKSSGHDEKRGDMIQLARDLPRALTLVATDVVSYMRALQLNAS